MAFNYDKAIAHIHKELGENTTFFISGYKDYKFEGNLEQLITWIFDRNDGYMTRRLKEDGKTSNQCWPNRYRSLGDIYKLCKHYMPDITLQQVRETLLKMNSRFHYCTVVHKLVFRLMRNDVDVRNNPYMRAYGKDEYGEMTTKEEIMDLKNAARTQSEYLRRMSKVN